MSELSPKDKDLLAGARAAWEPTTGAEDRILAAVLAKVGPLPPDGTGSGPAAPPPAPAAKAAGGAAKAWIIKGALVALGALGAGALVHQVATRPLATTPAASESASAAPPEVAPIASEIPSIPEPASASAQAPEPPASASATAAPSGERAARPRPAPASTAQDLDSLGRETALMREAQRALRDGHPDRALEILDKHAGSHPGGVLVEERLAARVQALCLANKVTEARAALAELRRLAPQSPQLARLAGGCAAR